ncbi:hypothetical protein Tco_0697618 [Tanacetum coccineum]
MAARGGRNNIVLRRNIDDLIDTVERDFATNMGGECGDVGGARWEANERTGRREGAGVWRVSHSVMGADVGPGWMRAEWDENNHSNGNVVKRGITRLCKFRREYGKPGGVKLSVTFDALNMISGKHKALFLSFLGDMVHEHIGLKILSWKKMDSEEEINYGN